MCGIFGVIAKENCSFEKNILEDVLLTTAKYSEVRGKDSSGIVFRDDRNNTMNVIKGPVPISNLLVSREFKTRLRENLNNNNGFSDMSNSFAVIGHARLTTNGTQLKDSNNQPVIKDGLIGIHNGIIVNVDELWDKHKDLTRIYDLDTEIMLSLLRKYINECNDTRQAVLRTLEEIYGTVASAILIDDRNEFVLTTNNGSLYILTNDSDLLIFASEYHILNKVLHDTHLHQCKQDFRIYQLPANNNLLLELTKFEIVRFSDRASLNGYKPSLRENKFAIDEEQVGTNKKQLSAVIDLSTIPLLPKAESERKLLEYHSNRIAELKRCSKCLLPETFPFISFDEHGVCNICKNYKTRNQPKPFEDLQRLVEPYRSKNGEPDCIVPFSGGRDSSFVLHELKTKLGLNPIAYTYDWGMVTDLARRNIARMCGKLGIEHIIVSANIAWKRHNIKKNIQAWLSKPSLGMIPLFMAGDKYFFYYCNQVKKQTGIKLNVWGINTLENTDFKTGFAGLAPEFDKKRIYSLNFLNQMKLFAFVGKNMLQSPGYINRSLLDTLGSFAVRYLYPKKDYYHFFDFYQWNEKEIEDTLLSEYDWETAVDTNSTWRIGDGTASFYNYIYCTVAGFTENDTFRSNQIREGLISRDEGLKLIEEENQPRYDTIKWYLEIIGMDFEKTIKKVNEIPKLY